MTIPATRSPPSESQRAARPERQPAAAAAPKVAVRRLSVHYGEVRALADVSLDVPRGQVTALVGPSGCGKSTFLRTVNRLNDLVAGVRVAGRVAIDGRDVYAAGVDAADVRRQAGMIFRKPNPFPKSIFENVAYGLRVNGLAAGRGELEAGVEASLEAAALWDEVKDRLQASALTLSGGQQQRLCIARALAVRPEILLLDEPAATLDPIETQRIEELLHRLKREYTIVVVTHNMQQAARVSDRTAVFWLGRLVEHDRTDRIFTAPAQRITEDYVTGRCG